MKYWGYLAAKLLGSASLLALLWVGVRRVLPDPRTAQVTDLLPSFLYSISLFLFWLVCAGVVWLIVLDQRYRCRTCLRKLRMPVSRGSWNRMLLLGRPHTEYICPYGHGTLKVPELQITGKEPIDWAEHQDIWKELELLDKR